jgi:hypothetical protein
MSDTRLGISLQVSGANAAADMVESLEKSIQGLITEISRLNSIKQGDSGYTRVLIAEKDAMVAQLASIRAQMAAVKQSTEAIKEQEQSLKDLERQARLDYSLGPEFERSIKSASDASRVLYTSLGALAEADAALRDSQRATAEAVALATARMEDQGRAVRTLSGQQFFALQERKMGLGQKPLSARDSGEVFQREGLTATEALMGMTAASVEFAQSQERIVAATQRALAALEQEALATQRLREELAIPLAPGGAFGRNGPGMGIPGFLAGQRNQGENESSGASRGRSGSGGGSSGAVFALREATVLGDELARGSRGAMISTLGTIARNAGVSMLALGSAVGVFGVALAAVHIAEKAEELGKWATQMKAAASATGMSLQAYSGLEGALRGLGLSGSEADASLRKISETLGAAIADPASKAAEAFHNMGISQEQLNATGGDTAQALHLISDAYARTADGANKTANMNEIAGRGFEKLVPLIQGGSGALDEMVEKARSLGVTLDEQGAAKLIKAGDAVRELGEVIRGQGIASMEAWSPVIIETVHDLEALIRIAGSALSIMGQVASFPGKVIQAANDFGVSISNMLGRSLPPEYRAKTQEGQNPDSATAVAPTGPKVAVPPLTTPRSAVQTMRDNAEAAALAAGTSAQESKKPAAEVRMAEARAEIASMQQTLATVKMTEAEKAEATKDLQAKQLTLVNEMASAQDAAARKGAGAANRAAKQSYEDFAANEKLKITEAQGDIGAITAIYNDWADKAATTYKQQANVILTIEREKTKALQEEAKKQQEAQLKAIKDSHTQEQQSQQVAKLSAEAEVMSEGRMGKGQTGQQATTPAQYIAEAQAIESSFQQYKAQLQQVADAAQQGGEVQKSAQEAIISETISAKTQEIALYQKAAEAAEKAAEKMAAPFTKMFDSMGSQFESLTSTLLNDVISPQVDIIKQGLSSIKVNEGSTQIHQAFRKFALDLVDQGVKSIESAVSHTVASSIDSSIQGGIGDLLGKTMSKLFQSAISSVVGNTVGQTAGNAVGGAVGSAAGNAAGQAVGGAAGQAVGATAESAAIGANAATISGAIAAASATQVAALTTLGTTITGAIFSTAAVEESLMAATAVKPEALGFSYAGGGIVPSAAGGMVAGNGATLARLHFQEMVLPAHLSNGIQTMINNGGAKSNASLNYSPTINTGGRTSRSGSGMTRSEFGQMMSTHGGAMMGEARNMVRNGFRAG